MKLLRNNLDRLEGLFKDSQEQAEKSKDEYEVKLLEVNDRIRTVEAENIDLKGKHEILFKLCRSYINRFENTVEVNENMNEEGR